MKGEEGLLRCSQREKYMNSREGWDRWGVWEAYQGGLCLKVMECSECEII